MLYIYTQWTITKPLKKLNNAIHSSIEGPGDYHTKCISQRQILCDIDHTWDQKKKKVQMNLLTKQK